MRLLYGLGQRGGAIGTEASHCLTQRAHCLTQRALPGIRVWLSGCTGTRTPSQVTAPGYAAFQSCVENVYTTLRGLLKNTIAINAKNQRGNGTRGDGRVHPRPSTGFIT